jgi:hypothetical protein
LVLSSGSRQPQCEACDQARGFEATTSTGVITGDVLNKLVAELLECESDFASKVNVAVVGGVEGVEDPERRWPRTKGVPRSRAALGLDQVPCLLQELDHVVLASWDRLERDEEPE